MKIFSVKIFFILCLAFLGGNYSGYAAKVEGVNRQSLLGIVDRLKATQFMRADFQQTKHVSALSKPLVSQGQLIFSRSQGIIWQIRKPFPFIYILTNQGVVQYEEGKKPVFVTAAQQPVVHEFIELFLALFSGDAAVLEDRFEIGYVSGKTKWQIELFPRNVSLRQFIASLQITGNKSIEEIVIRERGSDYTRIRLLNPASDGQLTSDEKRFFSKP